jgi:hypothetical protein
MPRNDDVLYQPCDTKFDKALEAMKAAQQKMEAAFRESFVMAAQQLARAGMRFRDDTDVDRMINDVRQGAAENDLALIVRGVKNFAGNVETGNVDFSSETPIPIFLSAALSLLDAAWDPPKIKDLSSHELEHAYRSTVSCRATLLRLRRHK